MNNRVYIVMYQSTDPNYAVKVFNTMEKAEKWISEQEWPDDYYIDDELEVE